MALMSKTSSAARLSIIYITVGTLTMVWSGIRYVWLRNHDAPELESGFYWCYGFMLSGLTICLIGILLGPIGWAARPAEVAVHGSGVPAPTVAPPLVAAAPVATNGVAQAVPAVVPASPGATMVTQTR